MSVENASTELAFDMNQHLIALGAVLKRLQQPSGTEAKMELLYQAMTAMQNIIQAQQKDLEKVIEIIENGRIAAAAFQSQQQEIETLQKLLDQHLTKEHATE